MKEVAEGERFPKGVRPSSVMPFGYAINRVAITDDAELVLWDSSDPGNSVIRLPLAGGVAKITGTFEIPINRRT